MPAGKGVFLGFCLKGFQTKTTKNSYKANNFYFFTSPPDALNRTYPEGGRGTADLRYKRPLPWRAPDLPQVPWGPTQDTARRTPRPLRPPALVAETRDFSSRNHRPKVDPFE